MSQEKGRGKLYLVGFGPGNHDHMTFRAKEAIAEAEVVVGYITYINLVKDLLEGKTIIHSGMREEVRRAKKAVDHAEEGKAVAVVSSGDVGVFGMAGLIFEVLRERDWDPETGVEIEIIPGVPAANSVSALLGAPLMHDYASISLSDLLTPWELIVKRIEAAASADFTIAFYNPTSVRRQSQIVEAKEIIARHRPGDTPVAIVRSAYRAREEITITDLDHMLEFDMGMLATIIVGNLSTFVYKGYMITPRGYQNKYEIGGGAEGSQRKDGADAGARSTLTEIAATEQGD